MTRALIVRLSMKRYGDRGNFSLIQDDGAGNSLKGGYEAKG